MGCRSSFAQIIEFLVLMVLLLESVSPQTALSTPLFWLVFQDTNMLHEIYPDHAVHYKKSESFISLLNTVLANPLPSPPLPQNLHRVKIGSHYKVTSI